MADNLSTVGRITATYDAAHRLVSLQQSFGASAGPQVDYQYDAANRLTTIARTVGGNGNAVRTAYGYDAADRLTTLIHQKFVPQMGGGGTTTPLATFLYGYDNANRVTTQVDAQGTATFTYDNTDQLTAVGGSRSETYGYDANGNRNTTGYAVTAGNRYSGGAGYTYTYDSEGNLTGKTKVADGSNWTYAYDHRNRLTSATQKNTGGTAIAQATYTYDALGRRIAVKTDADGAAAGAAVQSWTAYNGSDSDADAYADFDGSGTLTIRYLFGPALDALIARTSSGGTTAWYLPDRLGTVRNLADTTGTLIDTLVYDSYGKVTSESSPASGDRYKFTGREYDGLTQDYYYRTRYYDTATGRFLGRDSLGFDGGDFNTYRYTTNRPINATDPTGELVPLAMLAAIGIGALIGSVSEGVAYYLADPQGFSWTGVMGPAGRGALVGGVAGAVGYAAGPGVAWALGRVGMGGVAVGAAAGAGSGISSDLAAQLTNNFVTAQPGGLWELNYVQMLRNGAIGAATGGLGAVIANRRMLGQVNIDPQYRNGQAILPGDSAPFAFNPQNNTIYPGCFEGGHRGVAQQAGAIDPLGHFQGGSIIYQNPSMPAVVNGCAYYNGIPKNLVPAAKTKIGQMLGNQPVDWRELPRDPGFSNLPAPKPPGVHIDLDSD